MYGRLIWIATNEIPKMRKIRRVGLSVRTPRSEANARSTMRPLGTTSGRTSREPNVTSRAVPTDRIAEKAKTGGNAQPKPSMRIPASAGPTAKPTGPDAPKIAIVVPRRARGVTSRIPASMIPVLPSWNADEQHRERDLPRLAGQGHAGKHDRLDERAPDDDHLAAVLVGPRPPQRDERHADDEDQRAEQPDEGQPVRGRHAHLAQVCREQREDLADPEPLDHRGDPEDRHQDPPVLGTDATGSGRGRRLRPPAEPSGWRCRARAGAGAGPGRTRRSPGVSGGRRRTARSRRGAGRRRHDRR